MLFSCFGFSFKRRANQRDVGLRSGLPWTWSVAQRRIRPRKNINTVQCENLYSSKKGGTGSLSHLGEDESHGHSKLSQSAVRKDPSSLLFLLEIIDRGFPWVCPRQMVCVLLCRRRDELTAWEQLFLPSPQCFFFGSLSDCATLLLECR